MWFSLVYIFFFMGRDPSPLSCTCPYYIIKQTNLYDNGMCRHGNPNALLSYPSISVFSFCEYQNLFYRANSYLHVFSSFVLACAQKPLQCIPFIYNAYPLYTMHNDTFACKIFIYFIHMEVIVHESLH